MSQLKLDQTICQIFQLFHYVGLWQHDEESIFRKFGKKFGVILFYTLFLIFIATNAFISDDKNQSMYLIQATILVAVMLVKCLYLILKKDEILGFLNDSLLCPSIEGRIEYDEVSGKVKKLTKFVRVYNSIFAVTAVLVIGVKLPFLSVGEKGLPMFISFSYKDSEIIYWSAYLFVSLSIVLSFTLNIFSAIIWYIMLIYSIDYELLGNKFRKLGWRVDKVVDKGTKNIKKKSKEGVSHKKSKTPPKNTFVEDLNALIKEHRHLNE